MKPGDPGVPPGIPFAMIDFPQRIDNVKSSDTSMGPGWMGTFVVNKMIEVGKKFGEMPWAMASGYLAGCCVGEVLK